MSYNAIDLFCGCGGMTEGLKQAGYNVIAGVEIDKNASETYRRNHQKAGTVLFEQDIRTLDPQQIIELLHGEPLHLLVGCPPCQGFSAIRKKNKKRAVRDKRNNLILEYLRFVRTLLPVTIMLENVPDLSAYTLFKQAIREIKQLGYSIEYKVVNVANYGVPQRRKRLVLVGSLLEDIKIAEGTNIIHTVREAIGNLEHPNESNDMVHKIFPSHGETVQRRIELTPHDGGSREDLPAEYTLECHKKSGIGFHDVYGRLKWDDVSSTITGGCLNPSKGRFLHPEQDRCISAREAAMLQTFPEDYNFPTSIPRSSLALMIGNAIPPEFCRQQAEHITKHLDVYFMADVYDKEKRSNIMSSIKNKGTKPEIFIRKLLCELGYKHYRFKCKELHCKPDILFTGMRKAIFINGCFWHGHSCNRGHLPENNHEFWENKITANQRRDQNNYQELSDKNWDYLVIWQCEIKEKNLEQVKKRLVKFLAENNGGCHE